MIHQRQLFVNVLLNGEYTQESLHIRNERPESGCSTGKRGNYHENGSLRRGCEKDQQINLMWCRERERIKEILLQNDYFDF